MTRYEENLRDAFPVNPPFLRPDALSPLPVRPVSPAAALAGDKAMRASRKARRMERVAIALGGAVAALLITQAVDRR